MAAEIIIEEGAELGRIIFQAIGFGSKTAALPYPIHQRDFDFKKKVKLRQADDGKRVLKLSDAIQCVETACNDKTIVVAAFSKLRDLLIGGGQVDMGELIGTNIAECMRKKVLRQDKPEVFKTGPHRSRK